MSSTINKKKHEITQTKPDISLTIPAKISKKNTNDVIESLKSDFDYRYKRIQNEINLLRNDYYSPKCINSINAIHYRSNEEIKCKESEIVVVEKKTRCFKCSNYRLIKTPRTNKVNIHRPKVIKSLSPKNKTTKHERQVLLTDEAKDNRLRPANKEKVFSATNNNNKALENKKLKDASSTTMIEKKCHLTQQVLKGMISVAQSSFITLKENITIAYLNKVMLNEMKSNHIIKGSYVNILEHIKLVEEIILNHHLNIYEKQIIDYLNSYPSQTALMTISFLTQNDENEILKESSISLYLLDLCLVCLQEQTISYLSIREGFQYLHNKYKVTSIRNLLAKIILNKVFYYFHYETKEKELIMKLIKNLMKLFNSANRRLSKEKQQKYNYIKFLLLEINQYFTNLKYLSDEIIAKLREKKQLERIKLQLEHVME